MKKKATAIRIQIPEPCTQDFSKMHPLPGGHYCDHCERTVVDFRQMTDLEIVRLYQQRQGRVCGIFKNHQLDRALPLPQPPQEGRPWAAIAALASSLLLGNAASAQSTKMQTDTQVVDYQFNKQTSLLPTTLGENVTIDGWVRSNKGEPIPFANIWLAKGKQNGYFIGTESDFDGYFQLVIPINLIGTELEFSSMGYEPKSIVIEQAHANNQPIEIELKFGLTMNEVVVVYVRPLIERDITGGGMSMRSDYGYSNGAIEIKVDNRVKVTVFPNPFLATLNVEMEVTKAQPHLFHLYTEAGQLVFAESRNLEAGLQSIQLDLLQQHLPEGAYFLRISDDAGEIRTKRLVKVSP